MFEFKCENELCSTDKETSFLTDCSQPKRQRNVAQRYKVSGLLNPFGNNVSYQRKSYKYNNSDVMRTTNATTATSCGQNSSKTTKD